MNYTSERRMYTLRLSQELYRKVQEKVFLDKEKNYSRSINEYIVELIKNDLKK